MLDDQMRSHYCLVSKATFAVDASKPKKCHYDLMKKAAKHPKFKPSLFESYLREKHEKAYQKALAGVAASTDNRIAEHASRQSLQHLDEFNPVR